MAHSCRHIRGQVVASMFGIGARTVSRESSSPLMQDTPLHGHPAGGAPLSLPPSSSAKKPFSRSKWQIFIEKALVSAFLTAHCSGVLNKSRPCLSTMKCCETLRESMSRLRQKSAVCDENEVKRQRRRKPGERRSGGYRLSCPTGTLRSICPPPFDRFSW